MSYKKVAKVLLFLVFAAAQITYGDVVTKVLQNGLDGYSGCEDSYIRIRGIEPDISDTMTNFNGEDKLVISN